MKLLAIIGSPRLNGNTNYLVEQALGEAEKLGVQTEKIVLSQYEVNPCLGHKDCATFDSCLQKDDTEWILGSVCLIRPVPGVSHTFGHDRVANGHGFQ